MRRVRRFFQVLLDPQARAKHAVLIVKGMRSWRHDRSPAVPIFVFGKQRSGTTMLMHVFHLHSMVKTYDESVSNAAFSDFRIRSWPEIHRLTAHCRFPFSCFKPLADSHLAGEFMRQFPDGRFLWVYRNYVDVARSSLRRFANGTAPVREACAGRAGDHWFHEGLSAHTRRTLESFAGEPLSELDYACLTWWARNRLVVENGWMSDARFLLVQYEDLVRRPRDRFGRLFDFIGLDIESAAIAHIEPRETARGNQELSEGVERLCQTLLRELDAAHETGLGSHSERSSGIRDRSPSSRRTGGEAAPSHVKSDDRGYCHHGG